MDRSRPALVTLVALGLALIGLSTACDSGTQEPAAPAAPEPETSAATPEPSEATPATPTPPGDGSIAAERFPDVLPEGVTAEIPPNMPSSIPVYPGAEPAQGRGGERDGLDVAGVQLLSNDPVPDVYAYYESELAANGWDIVEATNEGNIATINATNGSARASVFVTSSPQGGTDIFVLSEF